MAAARKRTPRKGGKLEAFGTPGTAAQSRIDLAERFGMEVDPKDRVIVAAEVAAKAAGQEFTYDDLAVLRSAL